MFKTKRDPGDGHSVRRLLLLLLQGGKGLHKGARLAVITAEVLVVAGIAVVAIVLPQGHSSDASEFTTHPVIPSTGDSQGNAALSGVSSSAPKHPAGHRAVHASAAHGGSAQDAGAAKTAARKGSSSANPVGSGSAQPASPATPTSSSPTKAPGKTTNPPAQPAPPTSSPVTTATCGTLTDGDQLSAGQSLASCNGEFVLAMQGLGSLVLYQNGTDIWASNPDGSTAVRAILQDDGNFVLYNSSSKPVWDSDTDDNPGDSLVVQNDGNVVIYSASGAVLWDTRTNVS